MLKRNNILGLLVCLLGFISHGQQYRFKTSHVSVSKYNERAEKWHKWSDRIPKEVIVVLNSQKNRIVLYAEEIQLFNILAFEPTKEDQTYKTEVFQCSDNDGQSCVITIRTLKDYSNVHELYIVYESRMMMFEMKYLKE